MFLWLLAGGLIIVTVFVTFVLRDAIADDRRRNPARVKSNHSGY